jgi:hypothetical protein
MCILLLVNKLYSSFLYYLIGADIWQASSFFTGFVSEILFKFIILHVRLSFPDCHIKGQMQHLLRRHFFLEDIFTLPPTPKYCVSLFIGCLRLAKFLIHVTISTRETDTDKGWVGIKKVLYLVWKSENNFQNLFLYRTFVKPCIYVFKTVVTASDSLNTVYVFVLARRCIVFQGNKNWSSNIFKRNQSSKCYHHLLYARYLHSYSWNKPCL